MRNPNDTHGHLMFKVMLRLKTICPDNLFLVLLGVLSFQITFSQENFVPALVISHSGDTLMGQINYRNWDKNPGQIEFRQEGSQDVNLFHPLDIQGFRVADDIYISAIVDAEITPIYTSRLEFDPQIRLRVDTAFLRVLILGEKDLYSYKSPEGKDNFYISRDRKLELLIYKKYLKQLKNVRIEFVVMENRLFLGQLSVYLSDCPSISHYLGKTQYKQKNLMKLFQQWYECTESNKSYPEEKIVSKQNPPLGYFIGTSLTKVSFISEEFDYLVNTVFKPSVFITTGLFFDYKLPRTLGKWSVNSELMLSGFNISGEYLEYENEDIWKKSNIEISYTYLKINNLFRYHHSVGKFTAFVNGGVSNGLAIGKWNYVKTRSKFYTMDRTVKEPAIKGTRNHEISLLFGAGAIYKHIFLEMRYERGNGMSALSNLLSITNRFYLLFGYRF